jgi:glycerate kinase
MCRGYCMAPEFRQPCELGEGQNEMGPLNAAVVVRVASRARNVWLVQICGATRASVGRSATAQVKSTLSLRSRTTATQPRHSWRM